MRTDFHNNKHHFRDNLLPETNEGLDVGVPGQRFNTGRFKAIIVDTIDAITATITTIVSTTITTLSAGAVTITTSLGLSFLGAGYLKTDSGGVVSAQTTPIPHADLGSSGSATTVLHGNETFAAVSLTADVTGTLPVGSGGTNATTAAAARTSLGAAPLDPSYITLGTNSELSNERVLTAGSGITLTDAGAGSTLTVTASIPFNPIINQVFGG